MKQIIIAIFALLILTSISVMAGSPWNCVEREYYSGCSAGYDSFPMGCFASDQSTSCSGGVRVACSFCTGSCSSAPECATNLCTGVSCPDTVATCWDGSTSSCSNMCDSLTGSCSKCSVNCPEPPPSCTSADWSCTSWTPATCPSSATQSRTCTLTNTNCLNPNENRWRSRMV